MLPSTPSNAIYFLLLIFTLSSAKHILKESGDFSRRPEFIRGERADASTIHEVMISVQQSNLDRLEKELYDVSQIDSPNFGKHWSFEKVGELVSNRIATNAVVNWLRENKIEVSEVTIYGEYITAKASISRWESMLQTEMYTYTYTRAGEKMSPSYVIRGASYSIPEEMNDHIVAIHGITHLPPPITHHGRFHAVSDEDAKRFLRKSEENIELSATAITPTNLRSIYGITGTGNGLGSQAIYGTLGQTFLASDLAFFQSQYGLPNHPVDSIVGTLPSSTVCSTNPDDCIETSLDLQYMLAVAQTVPIQYYSEYPTLSDGFLSFARFLSSSANASNVYSISYGSYEIFVSASIITSFNTEAMKAGLRGITIAVSSGDDGIAGFLFRPGYGNPISNCGYYASWPASSPYVVAVGATMNGPAISNSPEIACSILSGSSITTGGGFSNSIAASSFQTAAITNYFNQYTATQSAYQRYVQTNRGYPDISMPGNYYLVRVAGRTYGVSGTSASSPVFAGMVALVNARRIQLGLTTTGLGWLNPSIYSNNGQFVLNDIVSGNNSCTTDLTACCSFGFTAVSGWDPVTGFGSIDYAKFLAYYTNTTVATGVPSSRPTARPSAKPSAAPSAKPSAAPSAKPSVAPSAKPSVAPSAKPSAAPSVTPSALVTSSPSARPTAAVVDIPTVAPSAKPTASESVAPSAIPTAVGTGSPFANPTAAPSVTPTVGTSFPSAKPTAVGTGSPLANPTVPPSAKPTASESASPSAKPTAVGTGSPFANPTVAPSVTPTVVETSFPSAKPTAVGTGSPLANPTASESASPSPKPTATVSANPSAKPSASPSAKPTSIGIASPSAKPTAALSAKPTAAESAIPTSKPTAVASASPSAKPTAVPSAKPTALESATPSAKPTAVLTAIPTSFESATPSAKPTAFASASPSAKPTAVPSAKPTAAESAIPTSKPTAVGSASPSAKPTAVSSAKPTALESATPSTKPTAVGSASPSPKPSASPSLKPSSIGSSSPSAKPTSSPSLKPSAILSSSVI